MGNQEVNSLEEKNSGVEISFKNGGNYSEFPELQKQIDALQTEVHKKLLLAKISQNKNIDGNFLNSIFTQIDQFQNVIESTSGDKKLRERYMIILYNKVREFLNSGGDDFSKISKIISQIKLSFDSSLNFDEKCLSISEKLNNLDFQSDEYRKLFKSFQIAINEYSETKDLSKFSISLEKIRNDSKEVRKGLVSGKKDLETELIDKINGLYQIEQNIISILNQIPNIQKTLQNLDSLVTDSFLKPDKNNIIPNHSEVIVPTNGIQTNSNEIMQNILSQKVGQILTNDEKKLLKDLGIQTQSLNSSNSIISIQEKKAEMEKVLGEINQKIKSYQERAIETDKKALELAEKLESIKKQEDEINKQIYEKQKEHLLHLQELSKKTQFVGKNTEKLGLEGNIKSWFNRIYSSLEQYNISIGFGNDDVIKGKKLNHFEIFPQVQEIYFPNEIIGDFDTKTGKGKFIEGKMNRYENKSLETTNTYFGSTNSDIVKLNLPQDWTVNTGSILLSKNIKFNILRDEYGFVYIAFDNPKQEKIDFNIGIGKDEIKKEVLIDAEDKELLTKPLYNGSFGEKTQAMLDELKSSKLSTKDKVQKVALFVEDNYVYVKDHTLNSIFAGKGNQIDAVEKSYVDYNGQKVHPAICQISANMTVAYLRALNIPSVSVGGYSKSGTEYIGHEWVRYYDEVSKSWINIETQPTRELKEVKHEFSDPESKEAYELFLKKQEIEKQKIAIGYINVKEIGIPEIQKLQLKLQNQASIYSNPQFLTNMLEENFQNSFDTWKNQFSKMKTEYYNEKNKSKQKELFEKKLKPSIVSNFNQILAFIDTKINDIKTNPSLYRPYFENILAVMEEVLKIYPDIYIENDNFKKFENIYSEIYSKDKSESLQKVLGEFPNGQQLLILNNKLYLKKKENLSLDFVMDLSKYEVYKDFRVTPDGRNWAFVAKEKSSGKYIIVKNGVELPKKFISIGFYDLDYQRKSGLFLSDNGDIHIIEESNEGYIPRKYDSNNGYSYFINDELIISGAFIGAEQDLSSKNIVVSIIKYNQSENINTIFNNGKKILEDKTSKSNGIGRPTFYQQKNGILTHYTGIVSDGKESVLWNDKNLGIEKPDIKVLPNNKGLIIYEKAEGKEKTIIITEDGMVKNRDELSKSEEIFYFLSEVSGNIKELKKSLMESNKNLSELNSIKHEIDPKTGSIKYFIDGKTIITKYLKEPVIIGNYVILKHISETEEKDREFYNDIIYNTKTGKITPKEEIRDFKESNDYNSVIFISSGDNGEEINYIHNGELKVFNNDFESIEVIGTNNELEYTRIKITPDGENFYFVGIKPPNHCIVLNNKVLKEINYPYPIKGVNLEFSKDFKHYIFSFMDNGKDVNYYNYLDGIFIGHSLSPIRIDQINENGKLIISSNQGNINLSNKNPDDIKVHSENNKLRELVTMEEFIGRAFELIDKNIKGQNLTKEEMIFLIQNYSSDRKGYSENPFFITTEKYKNLATQYLKESREYLVNNPNLDKFKVEEIKRNIGFAESFLSKSKTYSNVNLEEYLGNLVIKNIDLVFDEHISEQAKINSIMKVLTYKINHGEDTKDIVDKVKKEIWKLAIISKIESFTMLNENLTASHIALQQNHKWIDVLKGLRG